MNYQQLNLVLTLIAGLSIKELSIKSITALIAFQKELKEKIESYFEAQKAILDSYKVEVKDGKADWNNHEKSDEITKKISELSSQDYKISEKPFLVEEEFLGAAKENLKLYDIVALMDYIVIKDK